MRKMYAFFLLSFILTVASTSYAQSWSDFQTDRKSFTHDGMELKSCLAAKYQEYVICIQDAPNTIAKTFCSNTYRQGVEVDCYARELSCSEQYRIDFNVCNVSNGTATSLHSDLYFIQRQADVMAFQACYASALSKKNECVNEAIIRNIRD